MENLDPLTRLAILAAATATVTTVAYLPPPRTWLRRRNTHKRTR